MADFNLTEEEYISYFDDSLDNPSNGKIYCVSKSPGNDGKTGERSYNQPSGRPAFPKPIKKPVLTGTPATPPGVNSGWDAEQYVASALIRKHWEAHVVSRQLLGYDIFAQSGRKKLYIEVKSSLGICTPSLTTREWEQAKVHKNRYVLAIIENFKAADQNVIYWIQNPSETCYATQSLTISYSISRTSWSSAVLPFEQMLHTIPL
jgi:hypothetical protein